MWNISNILSISRIILAIPIVWGIINDNIAVILIFSIIAMATDYLDGYYARRLNQITELGKILDPAADKIIIIFAVIAMVYTSRLNLILALCIVLRDILIFAGGIYAKNIIGHVLPSNRFGKWTVTFISFYLILKLMPLNLSDGIDLLLMIFIVILLLASLILYTITTTKLIKNKQNPDNSVLDN